MRNGTRTIAITLALGWTMIACDDGGPTGPDLTQDVHSADEFSAFDVDATFDSENVDRGGASSFDQLAAEIPGFAGYFIDRGCNINVLLVDLSQAEKAKDLLTPTLRRLLEARPRCPDTATILVHPADYSWVQLKSFLHKLRPLAATRAVVRMGISIQENRVVILIASRDVYDRVVEQVQDLDVPLGAVIIRVHSGSAGRG